MRCFCLLRRGAYVLHGKKRFGAMPRMGGGGVVVVFAEVADELPEVGVSVG